MYNRALVIGFLTTALASTSVHAIAPDALHINTNNQISYIKSQAIEDKAFDFISSLTEQGIAFLADPELSKDERTEAFRSFLQANFDMKTIGRFTLGRYWGQTNDAQRAEYLELFEEMIITMYARRFGDYNGQELDLVSSRAEGKKDAIVSSEIVAGNAKVQVDWRVRQKKDGGFKVIDIIVEGVSMSLTQRSDFASVIQRGGGNIEVLLQHLRKK